MVRVDSLQQVSLFNLLNGKYEVWIVDWIAHNFNFAFYVLTTTQQKPYNYVDTWQR